MCGEWGVQQARWQIVRRKCRNELIYGQVHPYPSNEREPTIKRRPEPIFVTHEDNASIGLWWYMDGTKDAYGAEVWFQGMPNEEDYPEEDGWRDREEYERQQYCWHDVWDRQMRLFHYSEQQRKKLELGRRIEALFRETTGNVVPISQLRPGVIRVEEKLDKEPQDEDSCSRATTVRGSTRPAALGGTDSGIKKSAAGLRPLVLGFNIQDFKELKTSL